MVEVLGKVGTGEPAHTDKLVPKLNVGVLFGSTVIVKAVELAHCPAVGVNVYVPVF